MKRTAIAAICLAALLGATAGAHAQDEPATAPVQDPSTVTDTNGSSDPQVEGEPEGEDWAIWAPDIIYRNGKYYLYFPMRNILKDGTKDRYVAVAESDRMDATFTVTNPRMKGVERAGLDPSVFIDDDGEVDYIRFF